MRLMELRVDCKLSTYRIVKLFPEEVHVGEEYG